VVGGAALSLRNQWAAGAAVGLLADEAVSSLSVDMIATVAGYVAGALLCSFTAAACVTLLRGYLTQRVSLFVDAVCGCVLFCVAGMTGWKTLLLFG
jgi:hypothetical protein